MIHRDDRVAAPTLASVARWHAALWAGTGLLAVVGVFAATSRALHVDHLGEHMLPIRERMLAAAGRTDTLTTAATLHRIDEPFARFPAVTLLHVVPGGLWLLLAPLQLVRRIRSRHPAVHRWSGRLLLVSGVIAALTGMFFGVLHPFSGPPESLVIAPVGILFLVAVARAWLAIHRRDTAAHRRWMLRAVAVMFAVPLTRVLGSPLDMLLVNRLPLETGFVLDLAVSWLLTIGAAEWWIRRTLPVAATAGAARTAGR